MILTFQLNEEQDSIEILFDKEGHDMLSQIINKSWKEPIKRDDDLYDLDHEHISSKEWGGNELTPEFTSKTMSAIHSAKIVYLGEKGKELMT